ncbi:43832_t:CDS:2, partial [Gigaspora margarita]
PALFCRIKNKNSWCPHCNQLIKCPQKKLTLDDAIALARSKNGYYWFAHLDSVRCHNTWCRKCNHNNIDIANALALSKNGKCLSSDYIDNKTPLQWKCDKGHIFSTNLNRVKDHNYWCPICGGRNKTIIDMQGLARDRNGKCLSDKYYGAHTKLEWMCEKGHWCLFCSKYKWENLCREIVSKYLDLLSKNYKPYFLKIPEYLKGLELDIPYYDYRFAIEVQGRQYKKFDKFFHGDLNNFIKQQERDQVKKGLCDENDIYLFYIWYDDEDPEKTIRDELLALGLLE